MNNIIPVEVGYNLGQIQSNLNEVAASVRVYCDSFKNVVVTEDTVSDGKQMLANIRKEKKRLDDERKSIKKAWETPYKEFEKEFKEVISLYDETIGAINSQLAELEERRKQEKREEINLLFESIEVPESIAGWLTLSDMYDPRWENATFKMKDIEKAINDAYATLAMKVDTIKAMHHPYEKEGLDTLRETNDITTAMQYMTKLLSMEEIAKKKAQEQTVVEEVKKEEPAEDIFEDIPFDGPVSQFTVSVRCENSSRLHDLQLYLDGLGYMYEVKEELDA